MVRAFIEALGAYIGSAPMSDNKQGMRTRQIAFAFITALFVSGVWLTLRQ
jgi:predicted nucleic acid-binding Zn ribbon protein